MQGHNHLHTWSRSFLYNQNKHAKGNFLSTTKQNSHQGNPHTRQNRMHLKLTTKHAEWGIGRTGTGSWEFRIGTRRSRALVCCLEFSFWQSFAKSFLFLSPFSCLPKKCAPKKTKSFSSLSSPFLQVSSKPHPPLLSSLNKTP